MLEETLRSPTSPPAEVAQSLISFVRFELQDGGANAEKRFINLFSLLCERLFGPMGEAKEGFRHQTGGWLSRQNRWDIPRPQPSQHAPHLPSAPSIDMDPVVQLLCGMESLKSKEKLPTFIEAISGNTEARRGVRIQYSFYALPRPTQDLFLKMVQSAVDGSSVDDSMRSNAYRLLGVLLRVAPRDQSELRRILSAKNLHKDRSRPLSLSPGVQSPIFRSTISSSKPNTSSLEMPVVMLNMTEYFLISFIRYPLAAPTPPIPAPQGHQHTSAGITRHKVVPYGETVYLHLFRCYLLHFLPFIPQGKTFLGFPTLSVESEAFLRIIVEFWLSSTMEPMPIQNAAKAILERRKKSGDLSGNVDLKSAFDLVQVKYDPQPVLVQRCNKSLIAHCLRDPNVELAVIDCNCVASRICVTEIVPLPWCLSPSMTVLQQDFYKYVIASLRHAPIHVTGSPFYAALDSLLLWLEPWNVETRWKHVPTDFAHAGSVLANTVSHMALPTSQNQDTVRVLQTVKPTAKSKYKQTWEPFVAANLHLYTVPLALFLRRARELDFSSAYFSRSFALLQRVFRIYSPELVKSIHAIQSQGKQHALASLVEAHGTNLSAYSPALVGRFEMATLQGDVRNLLEEVHMQHQKSVSERGFFDRLEARIEGFFSYFGLVEASTGEERKIQQLVEKAKLIANLPAEYQLMPSEGGGIQGGQAKSSSRESTGQNQVVRINGVLTEHGKAQIISGEIMCKPNDIASIKEDRMRGSVKTHEFSWLVPLTIWASEYLNSRLDLEGTTKGRYRFNLRMLADYRNILFLVLSLWLWMRFLVYVL